MSCAPPGSRDSACPCSPDGSLQRVLASPRGQILPPPRNVSQGCGSLTSSGSTCDPPSPRRSRAVRRDLEDDDWTACQAVGNTVQYLGYVALFAPSATRAGDVITVYEPYLRAGQLEALATTELPELPLH